MAVELMALVWRAELDSTSKLVLLRLTDFAAADGSRVFPSVGRIASDTSLGHRTVQESLRRLEANGWIVLVREGDPAAKRGREYRIDVDRLARVGDGAPAAPVQEAHPCGSRTPAPAAPVQEAHPRGAAAAGVGVRLPHPDPSTTSTIDPPSDSHPPPALFDLPPINADVVDDLETMFSEFWSCAPLKVGKPDAARAFKAAVKRASFEVILSGIKRYAEQCHGKERRYIKHPAGWLRAERWNDPEETPQNTNPAQRTMFDAIQEMAEDTDRARQIRDFVRL